MTPHIVRVGHDAIIPEGYVRRSHPVFPEFVCHCSWWPDQIHQRNGNPDMVYLWIPKKDNLAYERMVKRERFCRTYCGVPIVKSCVSGKIHAIVAPKC